MNPFWRVCYLTLFSILFFDARMMRAESPKPSVQSQFDSELGALDSAPKEVALLLEKGRPDELLRFPGGVRARVFHVEEHEVLQNWVDVLTVRYVSTPTFSKFLNPIFAHPNFMEWHLGVSAGAALQIYTEKFKLENFLKSKKGGTSDFSHATGRAPRKISIAVFNDQILNWSGLTGGSDFPISEFYFQRGKITSIGMLELLIHETAIHLDPVGYSLEKIQGIFAKAKKEGRPASCKDLEDKWGYDHPAVSISIQAMRAFRFESLIINDLEKSSGMDLHSKVSFHPPNSEEECKKQTIAVAMKIGSFDGKSASAEERNQIMARFNALKDWSCLRETYPDFKRKPVPWERLKGPRPRLGGGG